MPIDNNLAGIYESAPLLTERNENPNNFSFVSFGDKSTISCNYEEDQHKKNQLNHQVIDLEA